MAAARPLREVFAHLAGDEAARHTDPAHLLRESGHGDLPETLVSEAVISFADTALLEVAEHLAPYGAAHSPVPAAEGDAAPDVDPPGWVEALATAPNLADLGGPDPSDALDLSDALDSSDALDPSDAAPGAAAQPAMSDDDAWYADVDFGVGGGTADPLDALDLTAYAAAEVGDVPVEAPEAAPVADHTGTDPVADDGPADDEPADDDIGTGLT
ncbi:MAG TPA: hypothetical protein VFR35_08065 [Actinoplanes sp.]|nr:hypothetical protein [Actinoplanes sp.]